MPEPRDATGNDALNICPNCDTPRVIGRHGSSDCIVALRAERDEANREIVRLGVVRDGLIGASDRLEAELERVTTERDHLDHMQAAFQTGIGLARLDLSGVTPDPALAMQRLNRAVEESDRLRATYRATSEQETSRCSCGKPERGRGPWHSPGRCALYAGALDLPIEASEQEASDATSPSDS